MGCWCTFTQRFLIEMPPKRGDFQCTVCGFRCRGRLSDQIGWWFHWANELHLGTLRIWLFWEGAPLWPRVNQANRLDWYLDPMIYIYIYSDMMWYDMYMWYYVILLFYDTLWCPLYFCMISWFYTVFSQGLTQTTRNRVKSLTSPGGSRRFMPWRIRLMATRCVLKTWVHGYRTMGAIWIHLGRSFVRFQPYDKKTDPCDSNTCNSFFTWKKTKVTGGIWTGWGIFTESRPSKSFCPTPNPAFATASVEVRTICLGAPCSVCSNPVCVDEKCSLWRPEFFVRLRPIWSHEDFTVPLW